VDLKREELIREGKRMRVPSKVYQVLLALLEKPGEVVTREDIRARLWPEGTFVNYDANVNTTVNKLRLALDLEVEQARLNLEDGAGCGQCRDRDLRRARQRPAGL
jgi:DNA-binding winged helix-turn-helix (wHTH) protein